MTYRILITGSRNYQDKDSIKEYLIRAVKYLELKNSVEIPYSEIVFVHGAARGADLLGANVAQTLGMQIESHPAEWSIHSENCPKWDKHNSRCRLAGPRRNQEMIDLGADVCIAFPLGDSRGTYDCIKRAKKAQIPVHIHKS